MSDDPEALALLFAARDAARDLQHGVRVVLGRAQAIGLETAWQSRSATAFHAAVEGWTGDLRALEGVLVDLEDEAGGAAQQLTWRLGQLLGRELVR